MTGKQLKEEIKRLQKQEKVDERQILAALKRRLAMVTAAQLKETDPDKRKANNEEIKELSNAIEKFERSVASRKSFWTWFWQLLITGAASAVVVVISLVAPSAKNKLANDGLGIIRRFMK